MFLNNKDLNLKRILDFKGEARATLIKNEVIKAKQNQYFFKNWCFPNQTAQELFFYLYKYGKVIYLNINGDLWFFPFEASMPFLTKSNAHLATFIIKEHFNKRILTKEFINDNIKKTFPFIFINSTQTAPLIEQEQLFEALKAVYNCNMSNRQNKNKSHIVFIPAGAKYNTAIYEHYTNPDASPFWYIENDKNNKKTNLKAADFNHMTTNTQDLYNTYSQEEKDIRQDIKLFNGIPADVSTKKGSAQETDTQTQGQKIETAFILKNELDELRRNFKNLRVNFPNKQIEIFLNDEIFNFMNSAINFIKNEVKDGEIKEEVVDKINLLDRVKNLLGLKNEKKPEIKEVDNV